MLKFERIIRNLSIEEKINLIVSNKQFENSKIDNYDLPEFKVDNFKQGLKGNVSLYSINQFTRTWNLDLIEKTAYLYGKHIVKEQNQYAIDIPMGLKGDGFGSGVFANGKFAASFIKGIQDAGLFACINKMPSLNALDIVNYRKNDLLNSEIAIKEGQPKAVISDNVDNLKILLNEWKYSGLKLCEVSNEEDLIRSINYNNEITLQLNEDFDYINCVKNAIKKYDESYNDLKNEKISQYDFDEMLHNGQILDSKKLDKIVDCLLYDLAHYASAFRANPYLIETDDELLMQVSNESLVLLKNEVALPIDGTSKVALLGKHLLESAGDKDSFVSQVKNFDLDISGYAYGYYSNEVEELLLNEAIDISKDVEYAIVSLNAEKELENYVIPISQKELVNKLVENGKKIIAILSTPSNEIDLSILDKCDAVLYINSFENKYDVTAALNAINGVINPNGHLTMPLEFEGFVKYPYGYGLNYSTLEFRNFKIDREKVSFTLENSSLYDCEEVVQIYVSLNEEEKQIRAFSKIKINSKEIKRFEIDLDDKTFRTYNCEHKCYEVLDGDYKVYLGTSIDNIEHEFNIHLTEFLDQPNAFDIVNNESNNSIDDLIREFTNTNSKEAYYRENNKMSFKKKLAINISLWAYVDIVLFIIFISVISNNEVPAVFTEMKFILPLLIFIAANISFVMSLIRLIKAHRTEEECLKTEDVFSKIDELDNFNEIYRETFVKPSIEEVEEEVIEEVQEEEIEVIEEVQEEIYAYKDAKIDVVEDSTVFSQSVSYEQICYDFSNFALNRGLILEPYSIRLLFSALSSSRLIFLRSVRKDLLPKLIKIFEEYLDNVNCLIDIDENVQKEFDLYWKKNEDGIYEKTEFVKALYQAKHYEKHINLIALNHVDINTLNNYFSSYIKYCYNPLSENVVNVGTNSKEELFVLPKNLYFMALVDDYSFIYNINKELADCSMIIDLNLRENEIINDHSLKEITVSYPSLQALIKYEKSILFLSEDNWKHIDELEDALSEKGKFRIENKVALQLEDFTSALLGCGSDEVEVLDSVLTCKILPITRSFVPYKRKDNVDEVVEAVERLIDVDIIPNAYMILKKPSLQIEESNENETIAENEVDSINDVSQENVQDENINETFEETIETAENEENLNENSGFVENVVQEVINEEPTQSSDINDEGFIDEDNNSENIDEKEQSEYISNEQINDEQENVDFEVEEHFESLSELNTEDVSEEDEENKSQNDFDNNSLENSQSIEENNN